MSLAKRPWNLSIRQRLLIVLFCGFYLFVYRPWAEPNPSIAASVYAGSAAMLALAALPPRLRLIYAVGIALAIAFVVFVAGRAVIGLQA